MESHAGSVEKSMASFGASRRSAVAIIQAAARFRRAFQFLSYAHCATARQCVKNKEVVKLPQ